MILTDIQKQFVRDIAEDKIKDLDSFISLHIELQPGVNDTNTTYSLYGPHSIAPKQQIFKVIDEAEALSKLRSFIALFNQLEKANLLISVLVPDRPPMPVCTQKGQPFYRFLRIHAQYTSKELIPFPELRDLIERDFQTTDELKAADETRDRKESLRLTRRVAYITIGISIALSLLSVLFNYLTYKTDRSVTITNANAFRDTTKVLVIGSPKTGSTIDSTHHDRK